MGYVPKVMAGTFNKTVGAGARGPAPTKTIVQLLSDLSITRLYSEPSQNFENGLLLFAVVIGDINHGNQVVAHLVTSTRTKPEIRPNDRTHLQNRLYDPRFRRTIAAVLSGAVTC